ADCRDRRHLGVARCGQGDHQRTARFHRPRRGHRFDGQRHHPAAARTGLIGTSHADERDMSTSEIRALARSLLDLCKARRLTVATAESCTGGLVAGALTEIPGSSEVVMSGFVSYSNDAKHDLLGVKNETLANFGAVSKETALAMATGGLKRAKTDLIVSITGIAGPGGATPGKPVGL